MNEIIIDGKNINIKEDIEILNNEIDTYIENILPKSSEDYEFLIREYIDALFIYNDMINTRDIAKDNCTLIKRDIELSKIVCKKTPTNMYELLKEEVTNTRGIFCTFLLSEIALIDPLAVLNTGAILFSVYTMYSAYITSNYKKNKERAKINDLLQGLKTNLFAVKYINSFVDVWQRKLFAIYDKLSLIESLPEELIIDDYILVRKKDKSD